MGVRYSMHQFKDATEEELKAVLAQFERNWTIWIWHHMALSLWWLELCMTHVFQDWKWNRSNVQEFVEEVHIVGDGSSFLDDQATLIPERLAELEGLTDDVTSNSGIKVGDTVFFQEDKPAAQFEAGVLWWKLSMRGLCLPLKPLCRLLSWPIVHRGPWGVFRKSLLQGILEGYQGASSSTRN